MNLPKYIGAVDIPLSVKLKDKNGDPIEYTDLIDALFYVRVNKVEQAKFSYNTKEGFDDAIEGQASNEAILPIGRDETIDWPNGRITVLCQLIVADANYSEGRKLSFEVISGEKCKK